MTKSDIGSTMSVQEVIDTLMKVEDKSLPVITEGCDCFGTVELICIWEGEVTLMRDNKLPKGAIEI